MNESDNRAKIKFQSRHFFGRGKRRNWIILLALLLVFLLLYSAVKYNQKIVRPVTFEVYPVGAIRPDSGNGNLNTAEIFCTIQNPSAVTQTVTFEITYDLLNTEKHFVFHIDQLCVENEDGTVSELPGTAIEVPGRTSLSLQITAVDRESSMELTTRGAPQVKVIPLNTGQRADETDGYTTDTDSSYFESRDERMAFLSKYLVMPSEVAEAAYHVTYQDNSGGRVPVPGPSDFEIRAAFSVKEEDISLWTAGLKKILPQQVDPGWWEDLKTSEFTWEIPSDAEYYVRPGACSYVVVCPDLHVVLKMVSTESISLPLEEDDPLEELAGYEEFKTAAADELGYDHSTVPYIRTMLAEKTKLSNGTELTLICYRALFNNSPLYGISVLVVSGEDNTFSTVLCDGSYWDEWYLADIDGDGQDELLTQHLISITGGAGAYETDIYQLSACGMTKIFGSPDQEDDSHFDTGFTLHLSEGFTHTIQNGYTGFYTDFTREASKETPYFDQEGNLTDDGRENNETDWLSADPYFFLFMPVDVDEDGIYEIMTAQYTYLYGRADGLGAAYTLLKWDREMGYMYVKKAGFWPYEDYDEDDPEYQKYLERWEEYENSWYLKEDCGHGNDSGLDSKALVKAASDRIREIDFHVRQYPVDEAFYGSAEDREFREAYYEAVTNQRPVLVRAYRSLDYEEVSYRDQLRSVYSSDQEFIRKELESGAGYYYTDYDGDGLPELIVRDTGLYGLKYDPKEDKVYLFMNTYSSYSYYMGDGQTYWYNPCLASKEIFSYESEDRNGNRVYAGFESVSDWKEEKGDWDKYYYITVDDFYYVEVKEKLWEELLGLLKDAYSETPDPLTFREFFEGFYEESQGMEKAGREQ